MIDRRTFLRRLGFGTVAAAAAATGVLDVERLLWTPGEKTIFLPPPIAPLSETFQIGDIFMIAGRYMISPRTYEPLPHLQQFVITSTISQGDILTAERIAPRIITNGPYQTTTGKPPRHNRIDGRDVMPIWVSTPIAVTHG